MVKLKTRLETIVRCQYCNAEERRTLRDTNVNSNISDDDARRMAFIGVGRTDNGYCEACGYITKHETVAYDLRQERV